MRHFLPLPQVDQWLDYCTGEIEPSVMAGAGPHGEGSPSPRGNNTLRCLMRIASISYGWDPNMDLTG